MRYSKHEVGRSLVMLWFLIVVVSATINIYVAQGHAKNVVRAQARTMFDHLVLTRNWNALHGGVYVPISDETQLNPYFKEADRDVVTEEGIRLTKINPAYMTRQVSELEQQGGGGAVPYHQPQPYSPAEWPHAVGAHRNATF